MTKWWWVTPAAIVVGAAFIGLAIAGYIAEDEGKRLLRECASIVRAFDPTGGSEELVRVCVLRRGRAAG